MDKGLGQSPRLLHRWMAYQVLLVPLQIHFGIEAVIGSSSGAAVATFAIVLPNSIRMTYNQKWQERLKCQDITASNSVPQWQITAES